MAILSNTIKILADSVKTIYFTIFYMMIQHPDKIKKEMNETKSLAVSWSCS